MSLLVKIVDQTTTGDTTHELTLEMMSSEVTVQELIKARVYQEVKDYNQNLGGWFRGLIQPTDTEQSLNGYKVKKKRSIDWEEQTKIALEGFQKNGFVILVDDKQVSDLEEEITLTVDTEISFLKLVPLIGG